MTSGTRRVGGARRLRHPARGYDAPLAAVDADLEITGREIVIGRPVPSTTMTSITVTSTDERNVGCCAPRTVEGDRQNRRRRAPHF